MNFTKRRPFLLWLQSVVVVVVVLSNTLVQVYAEIESIASLLSPELQHTRVVYEETGDTYVSFPDDANDLLAQELSDYPSPLVLEVTTVVTQWHDPLWDLLKGQVSRFQDEHHLVSVEVCHVCLCVRVLGWAVVPWESHPLVLLALRCM